MATFEAQVESLTSLALDGSSHPTVTELSQFLKDGVIDVTNRWLSVKPQDAEDFVVESTESSSQGALSTDGGQILHVMREAGVNEDWRDCRKISIGLKSKVTDSESLHFASIYNPAYILSQYGAVLVFPEPSGSTGQYRIYYVNKTPVDNASGAALAYGASTIRYFPDDKVYLVVIYAGIKALQAAMGALHGNSDVSTALGLVKTAVDQAAVAAGKFLTVDSDSIFGDEATFLTADSQLTNVKDALDKAKTLMSDDAAYNALSGVTDDVTNTSALYWLGDEDVEMVQATLQMVATEIQRAQSELSHWTSIGDMRMKEVQAALQEADGYAKEAQARAGNLQQEYTWYDGRLKDLKGEYDRAFLMAAPKQQANA